MSFTLTRNTHTTTDGYISVLTFDISFVIGLRGAVGCFFGGGGVGGGVGVLGGYNIKLFNIVYDGPTFKYFQQAHISNVTIYMADQQNQSTA